MNQVTFDDVMEESCAASIGGVTILVVSSLAALVTAVTSYRRIGALKTYEDLRRDVGRAILLGLEFLIIADIVLTITVDPYPRELPGPRAHRAGADLPQLLPSRSSWRASCPGVERMPARARTLAPDPMHPRRASGYSSCQLVRDQGPWLSALTWRQRGCWPTAARGHFRSQRSSRDYLLVS